MMQETVLQIQKILYSLTQRFCDDLRRLNRLHEYMHDRMMQEESAESDEIQQGVETAWEDIQEPLKEIRTIGLSKEFEEIRGLLHGFAIVHIFILLTSFVKQYLYQVHIHRARLIPKKVVTEISSLIEPLESTEEQDWPEESTYKVLDIFIWNELEALDKGFPRRLNEYLKRLFGKKPQINFNRYEELEELRKLRNEFVHYGGNRPLHDAFMALPLRKRNEKVKDAIALTEQYARAFHDSVSLNLE